MKNTRRVTVSDLHITTSDRVQRCRVGPVTVVCVSPERLEWLHRALADGEYRPDRPR